MPEEIRSILKERRTAGFYVYSNWIFSEWYEKVGLMIMIGLAMWKIWGFFI